MHEQLEDGKGNHLEFIDSLPYIIVRL